MSEPQVTVANVHACSYRTTHTFERPEHSTVSHRHSNRFCPHHVVQVKNIPHSPEQCPLPVVRYAVGQDPTLLVSRNSTISSLTDKIATAHQCPGTVALIRRCRQVHRLDSESQIIFQTCSNPAAVQRIHDREIQIQDEKKTWFACVGSFQRPGLAYRCHIRAENNDNLSLSCSPSKLNHSPRVPFHNYM
ncbi:uncharacterized protein K460DRAFT_132054 [Cucurbitaria berberidis CBS 394.84]|uniref:Uncharacterized protein n=1 Tax=Cucurbitaria berberidis CBS 394.84 TaxID=1168544 RepID=A0A9P4GKP5_9PLEO|nr:uncharacterized protein K460DRAFT_132054 [Cucurbitaria berberidis CBS 394.84]KAF1846850.1 hypothetical protein K460DRAFT_132054 [Cucurbitaria berberidis CBS 394.84]